MKLLVLAETDERLRQVCVPLTRRELATRAVQKEIEALLDFVYGAANQSVGQTKRDRNRPGTIGLSANQVGIMKQICVVDLAAGRRGYHDMQVLVNPRIVWQSRSLAERHEGCVNFPTTWGRTRRPASVRVAAWDRSGHEVELRLSGWAAALLLHEADHLMGRLFVDRLVDPERADLVEPGEFARYRKARAAWPKHVDVRARVRS